MDQGHTMEEINEKFKELKPLNKSFPELHKNFLALYTVQSLVLRLGNTTLS